MPSLRSPYQVLNLSPDAEPVVIEAAYRALIKKYHPDSWVGDPAAQHRAATINQAYATLRDPAAKTECDRLLRLQRNAAQSASFVPPPPRPARRGLWWGGWAAALFVGTAQFVPWTSLGERDEILLPAARPAKMAAAVPDDAVRPPSRSLAEAEAEWMRFTREAARGATRPRPNLAREIEAQERALALAEARPARPVRQRRAKLPRQAPAPRQSASEKEFLEREGYIY